MGIHKNFPENPYEILNPNIRWFPGDETLRNRKDNIKLIPPLVKILREKIKKWREKNYEGVTETTKTLLTHWFLNEQRNFKYYFCQREAIETIIYLYEIEKIKEPKDLIKYDSTGYLTPELFKENWKRFVIKMATGSGKTKVLSLVIVWAFFNKLYEENSNLSRNFLIITPNIIVLDRIKSDFEGLKIFFEDDVIPENWKYDFQLTVHLQDDVRIINKIGNLFISNIHRVYENEIKKPSLEDEDRTDYFLGQKPKIKNQGTDLSEIVRNIDEIIVLNDEAHHIHDEEMQWFKSIKDINNKLIQKIFFYHFKLM